MTFPVRVKIFASVIGATITVAPLVLFCLLAISGAFSSDPLDDAPNKGGFIFLIFGVPVIFLCALVAISLAVFLSRQNFVLSIPRLLLVSLLAPPVVVVVSTFFYAHDPVTVLTRETTNLLLETVGMMIFLGGGLLGSRWWLKRELKRTNPSTAVTAA